MKLTDLLTPIVVLVALIGALSARAQVNPLALPVDLNGSYSMSIINASQASTQSIGGSQVSETSSNVSAQLGTFTPFSEVKPPTLLQVDLLAQSYQANVSLAGDNWGASQGFYIGATSNQGTTPSTNGSYVKIQKSNGQFTFTLSTDDGTLQSGPVADTSGATAFQIVVSIDANGGSSATVTPLNPSGSDPTLTLGPIASTLGSSAAFAAGNTASSETSSTATMTLSGFQTSGTPITGYPGALYVFTQMPYLQPSGTVSYLFGQANLQQQVTGYSAQLAFSNSGFSFVSGSYTSSPYENNPGSVDSSLALSASSASANQVNAILATFSLTAGSSEGTNDLTFSSGSFTAGDFMTVLTAATYDANTVVVDGTPPSVNSFGVFQNGTGSNLIGGLVVPPTTIQLQAYVADQGDFPSGLAGLPTAILTFSDSSTTSFTLSSLQGNTFAANTGVSLTTPRGPASFSVTAVDRSGNSTTNSSGSFEIDAPPTANGQSVTVDQNAPTAITLTGSSPYSNEPLSYTIVNLPTQGTLSGTAPNLTYTPDLNYVGPDSFTFTVADSQGVQSSQATVNIQVNPLVVVSASVHPSLVIGGSSATGTVTLNAAPTNPAGATVTLSSSNASVARAAALTVNVPQGQNSTTFPIDTFPVTSQQSATITAALNGMSAATKLTVRPIGVKSVTLNPTSITGGSGNVSGTVTLEAPAAPGSITVNLTSNSGVATPPPSITIPAGSNTGSFTLNPSAVTTATPVKITASAPGRSAAASLSVLPVRIAFFTIGPPSIPGGQTATGTITLDHQAMPGNLTVTVTSNPSGYVTINNGNPVTVKSGDISTSFPITAMNVASKVTVKFTATLAGASKTASLTITPH